MGKLLPYCDSRFGSIRRKSRVVQVGDLLIGGTHPVRVQSMTTTNTLDIEATVKQTIELAEAGCEVVRITAPNVRAAEALGEISKQVRAAKISTPLVADIHFLPNAAMEAAKHVEKVRINPGNYADRKKFQIREYSDSQYQEELERLHQEFSPLVLRCKELGRSMRIGTNHGSLSDRIMNRFGDSPRGMAESALEFLRVARSHDYHQIILSMKASNPKVMIQAYRLVVSLMKAEGMNYPLHLGVTEAGDGEDARIKSAIGIGSLLLDGLGDTIRVSLTEDPVAEIPVAQDLVQRAHTWWSQEPSAVPDKPSQENLDPFTFERRRTTNIKIGQPLCSIGSKSPPLVISASTHSLKDPGAIVQEVAKTQVQAKDAPVEALLVELCNTSEMEGLETLARSLIKAVPFIIVEDKRPDDELPPAFPGITPLVWLPTKVFTEEAELARFLALCEQAGHHPAVSLHPAEISEGMVSLLSFSPKAPIITLAPDAKGNPVGDYRRLASNLDLAGLQLPLWIRNQETVRLSKENLFSARLLDSSILSGSLLCDGLGDLISVENLDCLDRNRGMAFNILQGARARISKTEFVACPSCGRTLFDLQSTTQKVKTATGHLKGVTIAVMGCIVNGPGEMADADFGYVGSGPGKIDLYVGKNRVNSAIPETDAVDRLVNLIQEEGKWIDP
jgi:(E)-4-hydroxy-3-methylbut-2-enyl-diphosphate synthase